MINGVDLNTYNSNVTSYSNTLKMSIASCMSDVSPSNIINLVVTDVASSSIMQRMGASLLASSGSINTVYDVSVRDPSLSYNSLSSQLSTAVSDGTFTSNLQTYSTSTGATGFATASSTSVTTADLLDDDGGSDDKSLSAGAIAGIAIGCAAFMALLGAAVYYYFSSSAGSSSLTARATASVGGVDEVGNPMGKKGASADDNI